MFLSSFNFRGGVVLYNDLDNDDLFLKEDLLQVEYSINESSKIIVDVGWYGYESEQQGIFRIFVLKDSDRDNPLYTAEFKSLDDLKIYLNDAIEFVIASLQ